MAFTDMNLLRNFPPLTKDEKDVIQRIAAELNSNNEYPVPISLKNKDLLLLNLSSIVQGQLRRLQEKRVNCSAPTLRCGYNDICS
jgi:hypothetical protein